MVARCRQPQPEKRSCSLRLQRPDFWVPQRHFPSNPKAVSPQILTGYPYDSIRVPDTTVETNPQGEQTVNLPTWVWLDKVKFKPVSVTASPPGTQGPGKVKLCLLS